MAGGRRQFPWTATAPWITASRTAWQPSRRLPENVPRQIDLIGAPQRMTVEGPLAVHIGYFTFRNLAVIAVGDRRLDSLLCVPGVKRAWSGRRRGRGACGAPAASSPSARPAVMTGTALCGPRAGDKCPGPGRACGITALGGKPCWRGLAGHAAGRRRSGYAAAGIHRGPSAACRLTLAGFRCRGLLWRPCPARFLDRAGQAGAVAAGIGRDRVPGAPEDLGRRCRLW